MLRHASNSSTQEAETDIISTRPKPNQIYLFDQYDHGLIDHIVRIDKLQGCFILFHFVL